LPRDLDIVLNEEWHSREPTDMVSGGASTIETVGSLQRPVPIHPYTSIQRAPSVDAFEKSFHDGNGRQTTRTHASGSLQGRKRTDVQA
jgi:hypothetical protein